MILNPKFVKHKKYQKGRIYKNFYKYVKLKYGTSGLMLLRNMQLTSKQLFKFKVLLKRGSRKADFTKRFLWVSVFANMPITRKVQGSRMGKGKGKQSSWNLICKGGTSLFEYKNLRYGRSVYFFKQIQFRLNAPSIIKHSINVQKHLPLNKKKLFTPKRLV